MGEGSRYTPATLAAYAGADSWLGVKIFTRWVNFACALYVLRKERDCKLLTRWTMRRILLTLAVAVAAMAVQAQTVLTEAAHGLLPGNPNPMIITTFSTPGQAGENVTWDFSALPQVAPFHGDVVDPKLLTPPAELLGTNSCLVEGGLEAFMTTNAQQLNVMGLRVDGNSVRLYQEPVLKMRYPFAYGDRFEGQSAGVQRYQGGYEQPLQLTYQVQADAYGTLMLPGTTLRNALRVATTHTIAYGSQANPWVTTVVTYRWYVASHRYPVLSLIFERRKDGTLEPLKGAYNPVIELPELSLQQPKDEAKGQLASVSSYPNPFDNSLTVSYKLLAPSNVTIAMYDMRGMLVCTLLQRHMEAGEYENAFTSQVARLQSGQYLLRVEASGNTLVQSVVKVQ